MPRVARSAALVACPLAEDRSLVSAARSDGLVVNRKATVREKVFVITETQREFVVKPCRASYDNRREMVTAVVAPMGLYRPIVRLEPTSEQ